MMRTLLRALPLLLAAGCTPPPPAKLTFPARTTLTPFASARCSGGRCECRSLEAALGQAEEGIAPGQKRFEFRLPRTPSALWVSVEGRGVFYKPPEQVLPVCFYLDLPPGEHRVTVHAERKDLEVGLQSGLTLYEYGAKEGPHWYRALEFVCGGLGKCEKPGMQQWVADQRRLPRGVLDPCGSTMIRGVQVTGTREERLLTEYLDVDLTLTMKIYGFETFRQPGSAECRAPVKNL